MAADRPRIALVTDAVSPWHRGGKEMRYRELAQRLTAVADVHVYTMNWWRGGPTFRDRDVTYHALSPLLPLYSGERRSVRQAVMFALCCLRLLREPLDAIEADHMPYMQLFPLRLVASLRRVPLVVTWHEFWGPGYWRDYLGPPGRLGWWAERAAMGLPDTIIAASAETAERLRAHVGHRVPVVAAPNGVNAAEIAAVAPSSDSSDIVVVGRLLPHKRIDLLLEALALLAGSGRPLRCRVIGDGPERRRLHDRARTLRIDHLVDFRHDVEHSAEVFALVKAARVFAFPSAREGFGIAVLEALACGVPVVTTTAPDNLARTLVERSAHGVVCAPERHAFAAALLDALDAEPGGADDDGWIDEFDWARVTDRVAEAVLP